MLTPVLENCGDMFLLCGAQCRDAWAGQEPGRKGPSSQANCTRSTGIGHTVAVDASELDNGSQLGPLLPSIFRMTAALSVPRGNLMTYCAQLEVAPEEMLGTPTKFSSKAA